MIWMCVFQLLPPPPPSSLAAAKSRMVWRSCTGLAYTGCPQNWPLYECSSSSTDLENNPSNCHFWHATQDCVAPYADHNLQRGRFWAISIASGSVRLWDLRSCCIVILHQPCDAGTSSWSPPVLWRESWQDPLGICVIVHARNVPKKGSGDVTGLLQWTNAIRAMEVTEYISSG